jgi:hypothetical protein
MVRFWLFSAVIRYSATCLLLFSFCFISSPAGAQDDPVALFNQASGLAEEGKLDEAIRLWVLIADDIPIKYQPVVRVNLGLAYQKQGALSEAWYHFNRYLQLDDTPDPEVAGWKKALETELEVTHRRIIIQCSPKGARVHLIGAGEEAGYLCPFTWWFSEGDHQILVKRAGLKTKSLTLTADSKAKKFYSIDLGGEGDKGTLVVNGDARAVQVFLDGRLEGAVPFSRKLLPGEYELMVGAPGKMPWKKKIIIETGKTITEAPEIAQKPKTVVSNREDKPGENWQPKVINQPIQKAGGPTWWTWSLLGAGMAGIGAGATMHFLAYNRNQDLLDKYPDGNSGKSMPGIYSDLYRDAYAEDVKPKAVAAYVLYGFGGAAVAASMVLLIAQSIDKSDDTPVPAIGVMPMPEGAGMQLMWSWE